MAKSSSSGTECVDVVKLGTKDWIWLIVVIAGMTAANMSALYMTKDGLENDMILLDEKWQSRTENLARDIRGDLKDIRANIPPDWFERRVDHNTTKAERNDQRIDQLEKDLELLKSTVKVIQNQLGSRKRTNDTTAARVDDTVQDYESGRR